MPTLSESISAMDWSRVGFDSGEYRAIGRLTHKIMDAKHEVQIEAIKQNYRLTDAFDQVDFCLWTIFPSHTRREL
jgi:hypothetical protein